MTHCCSDFLHFYKYIVVVPLNTFLLSGSVSSDLWEQVSLMSTFLRERVWPSPATRYAVVAAYQNSNARGNTCYLLKHSTNLRLNPHNTWATLTLQSISFSVIQKRTDLDCMTNHKLLTWCCHPSRHVVDCSGQMFGSHFDSLMMQYQAGRHPPPRHPLPKPFSCCLCNSLSICI